MTVRFLIIIVWSLFSIQTWYSEVWAEPYSAKPEGTTVVGAEKPYSLTISGGVSLGVYEAGLNAVIIDALKDEYLKNEGTKFRLDAVTGASAGAINALISAIRFCEDDMAGGNLTNTIYKNLFRTTWENIDVEELLSENPSNFDQLELDLGKEKKRLLKDSLLSRKIFENILQNLRQRINDGHFRDEMVVKMAFTVTRSVPLAAKIKTIPNSQKIYYQRLVIPLVVMTKRITKGGISRVGLFFKNDTNFQSSKEMEHLLLPESDGYVEFDQIARAVLASSAFPLAFSRVELAYCERANSSELPDDTSISSCPKGYRTSSGFFSDGGTFDNVPLGVAVELIEQNRGGTAATYIYLDPTNRRSVTRQSKDTTQDQGSLVLTEQVKSWTPAFETLMNGELYRSLTGRFSTDVSNDRALLLTRRFPPLTGNFLSHFGAFLDPSFRLYDYSAGVYDGLMNVAEYKTYLKSARCRKTKEEDADCISAYKAEVFYDLAKKHLRFDSATAEDREIHQLLRAFLEWEKTAPAWNKVKELFSTREEPSPSYTVYEALTRVGDSDFNGFLAELKNNKEEFGEPLQELIDNPDWWGVLLGRRAINRLVDIEKNEKGDLLTLLKLSAIVANSKTIKDNKTVWAISSAPRKKVWHLFVPDAIELDAVQTGIALSYLYAPKSLITNFGHFEWQIASAHVQIKEIEDERIQYWSSGGAWRVEPFDNAAVSSIGLGLYPNQNFGNTGNFGKKVLLGGEVSIGLVGDKLRLTIGTRDLINNYRGEDWSVRFGFTDIDGWLSLF